MDCRELNTMLLCMASPDYLGQAAYWSIVLRLEMLEAETKTYHLLANTICKSMMVFVINRA